MKKMKTKSNLLTSILLALVVCLIGLLGVFFTQSTLSQPTSTQSQAASAKRDCSEFNDNPSQCEDHEGCNLEIPAGICIGGYKQCESFGPNAHLTKDICKMYDSPPNFPKCRIGIQANPNVCTLLTTYGQEQPCNAVSESSCKNFPGCEWKQVFKPPYMVTTECVGTYQTNSTQKCINKPGYEKFDKLCGYNVFGPTCGTEIATIDCQVTTTDLCEKMQTQAICNASASRGCMWSTNGSQTYHFAKCNGKWEPKPSPSVPPKKSTGGTGGGAGGPGDKKVYY